MTRGKYAAKAAVRREAAQTTNQIEAYQHAVRRLTQERDQLRERLDVERRSNAAEIKRLKALISANVAPELRAAHDEVAELRKRIDAIQRNDRQRQRVHDQMIVHMRNVLIADGYTMPEAIDLIAACAGSLDAVVKVTDNYAKSRDVMLAVDRATGERAPKRRQDDPEWRARYHAASEAVGS